MAAETMRTREQKHADAVAAGLSQGAARRYSWAPFEAENWAALRHGAESPRQIRPLAEAFDAALQERAPWCGRPAFEWARTSWAWAEAQLLLLRIYIDDHGSTDATTERAMELEHKIEGRAVKLRQELGLTPQSLAKLLSSLASVAASGGDSQGLAAVKAEGQAIVAAREQQLERGDDMDEAKPPR